MRANQATDAAPPAAPSLALMDREPSAVMTAPPAAAAVPMAGPMGSALQAMQAGIPLADLRGLLDLQKDWEANEARKAYVADMAAFKLDPPEIFKTKNVSITLKDGSAGAAYSHATLGDVCEKIVEGLAQYGFSHRWDTKQPDGGQVFVTCTLTHRLGHSESTTLNSSRDETGSKNNIQALASTITYLQRYTLLGASGLATKDVPPDDDGNGADGAGAAYDAAANLAHWLKQAREAATEEAIAEVRAAACNSFEAARDLPGWETVRDEIKAIRTARREKAAQQ